MLTPLCPNPPRINAPHFLALIAALLFTLAGCGISEPSHGAKNGPTVDAELPVVELASLMGEMQRHSAKLGYAIAGHNKPLVEFYLHEVEEVLAGLKAIEAHEGMPIAHPARVIFGVALEDLEDRFSGPEREGPTDWPDVWQGYLSTIEACNRCHLATEHGFIEILPAAGPPPYNQHFGAEAAEPDE